MQRLELRTVGFDNIDAEAAVQAIENLVSNAMKYSPERRDVEVQVERADGYGIVRVRDYGVGMSPNPNSPGPGLGLSVIGALAAEVNIERPGDGGTRVRIRFPLAA